MLIWSQHSPVQISKASPKHPQSIAKDITKTSLVWLCHNVAVSFQERLSDVIRTSLDVSMTHLGHSGILGALIGSLSVERQWWTSGDRLSSAPSYLPSEQLTHIVPFIQGQSSWSLDSYLSLAIGFRLGSIWTELTFLCQCVLWSLLSGDSSGRYQLKAMTLWLHWNRSETALTLNLFHK